MDHDTSFFAPKEPIDPVEIILRSIASGETSPIIAFHRTKAARSDLLARLIPALCQASFRVITVDSRGEPVIVLDSLMDQVVGHDCADPIERSEKCHSALTCPEAAETRIALMIDDAHLLADTTFQYLDLVTSIGQMSMVPLQIILVGGPELWERLPQTGRLAAHKIKLYVPLPDAFVGSEPEANASTDSSAEAATSEPTADPVATERMTVEPLGIDEPPAIHSVAIVDAVSATGEAGSPVEPASFEEQGPCEEPVCLEHPDPTEQRVTVGEPAAAGKSGVFEEHSARQTDKPPAGGIVLSETPLQRPANLVGRRRHSKRFRLALAASVAIVVFGGGLALSPLPDALFDPRNLERSIAPDQVRQWFDRFVPTGLYHAATAARVAAISPSDTSSAPPILESGPTEVASAVPADKPAEPLPTIETPQSLSSNDQAAEAPVIAGPVNVLPASPPLPSTAPPIAEPNPGAEAKTPPPEPSTLAPVQTAIAPQTVFRPNDASGTTATVAAPPPPAANMVDATKQPVAPAQPPLLQVAGASAGPTMDQQPRNATALVGVPPPAAPAASKGPSVAVSPGVVTVLITRGDELLATGDVTAARLMYQRAAKANSALGAIALGMTYDPSFLASTGAQGVAAEPRLAVLWYKRAAELGSVEAARLLTQVHATAIK